MTMSPMEELLSGHNRMFLEELYEDYLNDPGLVDQRWRSYFDSVSNGGAPPTWEAPLPTGVALSNPFQPPRSKQAPGVVHHSGTAAQNGSWTVEGSTPVLVPGQRDSQEFLSAAELPSSGSFFGISAVPVEAPETVEFLDLEQAEVRLSFLRKFKLFQGLSEEDLGMVSAIAVEARYGADEYIFRQGSVGEDLYVIVAGLVFVERDGRFVVELGAGEVVGELSALDGRPRSADIRTHTPVQLLALRGKDFKPLMTEHPSIMSGMLKILVGRVRVSRDKLERVIRLVRSYRVHGHLVAKNNPLELDSNEKYHRCLTLERYGLTEEDLDSRFTVRIGSTPAFLPLRQIIAHLQRTYCGAVGVQFMHIDDPFTQEWMRSHLEDPAFLKPLDRKKQLRILTKLTDAEVFETFLHSKFLGAKRFSLEGSESLIPLLDEAIEKAGEYGVDEVIIGMAHRGRLNVLVNILEKPADQVFREFEDADPEMLRGKGDVKYHMGFSSDRVTGSGRKVHLSLCFNPSHLEAVAPVVLGRTRAKQERVGDHAHKRGMPIVIHGDSAFIGQGVVQELFNMSELPAYAVGGTLHIVVNNQIGFTTTPDQARSSYYATDIARMLQIPVFHVNGEDPEAVDRVIQIAMAFREQFGKDIVIDMYGYRKHGHNEGDEPAFTQPQLYRAISKKPTVREVYVQNLLKLNDVTKEEAEAIATSSRQRLEEELAEARKPDFVYEPDKPGRGLWSPYIGGPVSNSVVVDTGVPREHLQSLLALLTAMPENFTPHRKIQRFSRAFARMASGDMPLNWGAAESLAYCTLLTEGVNVRITGQDAERGTFSHRHAVLHDVENGNIYIPMQHLAPDQGRFGIHNSPLSEIAVLGFEFGYSLDYPDGLTIWEAQFGDFCNMAQVIIDQFISCSEEKWNRMSGLCMLLPHGFEGQGPEHSSARLERFLTLAAEDNIQVVNLTTPAQIFHCLRRQVHNPWRKPLIVMSPKSLLRNPQATSSLEELVSGIFQPMLADSAVLEKQKVERVILCTGKIYYELEKERAKRGVTNIALLRVEQLYPFPFDELDRLLQQYSAQASVLWVQEEPENMGAWPFMLRTFGVHAGRAVKRPLHFVARPESASPATGSKSCHDMEQAEIIDSALSLP